MNYEASDERGEPSDEWNILRKISSFAGRLSISWLLGLSLKTSLRSDTGGAKQQENLDIYDLIEVFKLHSTTMQPSERISGIFMSATETTHKVPRLLESVELYQFKEFSRIVLPEDGWESLTTIQLVMLKRSCEFIDQHQKLLIRCLKIK